MLLLGKDYHGPKISPLLLLEFPMRLFLRPSWVLVLGLFNPFLLLPWVISSEIYLGRCICALSGLFLLTLGESSPRAFLEIRLCFFLFFLCPISRDFIVKFLCLLFPVGLRKPLSCVTGLEINGRLVAWGDLLLCQATLFFRRVVRRTTMDLGVCTFVYHTGRGTHAYI